MRYPTGAALSILLSSSANVDQLKARLQMGYEAAAEARAFVTDQDYGQAKVAFSDALNLGRRPAISIQELDASNSEDPYSPVLKF